MPPRTDLAGEAFLILADVAPLEARALWLHVVDEKTHEEVALACGRTIKTVARWIHGFTHTENGRFYPGAKQLFERVYRILVAADDTDCLLELLPLFDDGRGRTAWGTRFPAAVLEIADAACAAGALGEVSLLVGEARKASPGVHVDVWGRLLTLYSEERLGDVFPPLRKIPRDGRFLERSRTLLQEHVPG